MNSSQDKLLRCIHKKASFIIDKMRHLSDDEVIANAYSELINAMIKMAETRYNSQLDEVVISTKINGKTIVKRNPTLTYIDETLDSIINNMNANKLKHVL